jgi:DNA-binding transcriptional ArsR family regulator
MNDKEAISLFDALAQESRLAIFRLLVRGGSSGMNASTVAERLSIPAPTLSFHLRTLCQCGLVDVQRKGRFMIYRANISLVTELTGFLLENCCAESPGEPCLSPEVVQDRKEKTS